MDTIGIFKRFSNSIEQGEIGSYLNKNFELANNKFNPYNIVDLTNYKLFYLKNIRIMLFSDKIKIQGSISKYLNGHNNDIPSDKQIMQAFEKIQLELPIVNWYQARVSRVDYGVTFPVSVKPAILIPKFIDKKNAIKAIYKSNGDSVRIGNKSQETIVYDKGEESGLDDQNLIRIEYKMLKPKMVSKNFGIEYVTLGDLLKNLYILPECWYKNYKDIIKDYSPCFKSINSKNEFIHVLVHAYGYENCLNLVKSSYQGNNVSESQKINLKRFIRKLANEAKSIAKPSSPIIEVDMLVEEHFYRCKKLFI